jgi:hypothetical protein
LALLVFAACSSSGGSGSLTGQEAFTVTAQFAGPNLNLGITGANGAVLMGNVSPQPTCADLFDGGNNFTGKFVSMILYTADGGAVGTGSYTLADPRMASPSGAFAYLGVETLGDGGTSAQAIAISGTLNLTSVGSNWEGNFNSQLISADQTGSSLGSLSGTFSAPVCN